MSGVGHLGDSFAWGGRLPDGRLEQRDLSAHDVIAGLVFERMAGDATLVEIFEGGIYRYPHRIEWDIWDSLPSLQVYAGTVQEVQAPTDIAIQEIEVFLAVVFDAQISEELVTETREGGGGWEPSLGTLIRYIQGLLRTDHQLTELVGPDLGSAVSVPLAHQSRPGAITLDELVTPSGDRVALIQEISWLYTVHVLHSSGRIKQIDSVGGS